MTASKEEPQTLTWKWFCFHMLPALLVLMAGAAGILKIAKLARKEPEIAPLDRRLPSIEAIEVSAQSAQLVIESQGTVQPRIQTALIAEVSGRVTSVDPALYAGGSFREGQVLATIDDTDYIALLASSKSQYAEAKLAYQQELALSAQASVDWDALQLGSAPNDLALRKPQLERARTLLEAAEANLAVAETNLERTRIRAPYDGRVRSKHIDLGQFVNARSTLVANIFSNDLNEVRLPISLDDLGLVETLAGPARSPASDLRRQTVELRARYGGKEYQWIGYIDRTEAEVDPQTRLLHLIAQVDAAAPGESTPALKVGTFVSARIFGKTIEDAFVIPRRALREGDTLHVVSEDNRLEIRSVEPLRKGERQVILTDGLKSGERLSLTPLQFAIEGIEVEIDGDDAGEAPDMEAAGTQEG